MDSVARNMPANLENSAVATGLEQVSFHSIIQRRDRASGVPLEILKHLPPKTRDKFPALAGRFFTTVPPGKPIGESILMHIYGI